MGDWCDPTGSDTNGLKTGARQSRITHARVEKGNKKNSHRNVCALLTCLLMGDPESDAERDDAGAAVGIASGAMIALSSSFETRLLGRMSLGIVFIRGRHRYIRIKFRRSP
jgi:hypothetical protein